MNGPLLLRAEPAGSWAAKASSGRNCTSLATRGSEESGGQKSCFQSSVYKCPLFPDYDKFTLLKTKLSYEPSLATNMVSAADPTRRAL